MKFYKSVSTLFVGLILVAFGGTFLWREMKTPPSHTIHLAIFSGFVLLGAMVIQPDPVMNGLKRLASIASPYIPGTQARAARLSGTTPVQPDDGPTPPPPPAQ